MKSQNTIIALAIAMALVGRASSAGCDCGKDVTAQEPAKSPNATAGTVIKQASGTVKEVAATGSAKAQEFISSAQGLVAQGKFQAALGKRKEIGGEKLSPTQQSIVEGVKTQSEKALAASTKVATEVGSNASGLLKK